MRLPILSLSFVSIVFGCGGGVIPSPTSGEVRHATSDSRSVATEPIAPEAVATPERVAACAWTYEASDLHGPPETDLFDPAQPVHVREVSVDDDGRADLIANVGNCGNWGDCVFVLLRGCEGGGYEALWGPEYAQDVRIGTREEGATYAPVHLMGRTAAAGCDVATRRALRFENGAWAAAPECSLGDGIWSDACGYDPPPQCAD